MNDLKHPCQFIEAIRNMTMTDLKIISDALSFSSNRHRDQDDEALRYSAKNDHLEVFRYLVDQGAAIAIHTYDLPLQWSDENSHLDVVRYLVDQGANIHAFYDNN
jgi:ankyrin repeat protein